MFIFNWLYRDQYLAQNVIDQYEVGKEYSEPAFVDCTKLQSSLLSGCNFRYLIVSNKGVVWSRLRGKPDKWEMVVFPRGLSWKVLDKYERDGATQLLISPDSEEIEQLPLEDLIALVRANFDELWNSVPAANLDNDEWKNRLFFPIGIRTQQ